MPIDYQEQLDIYEDAMDEALDLLFDAHVKARGEADPAIVTAWAALWCARHPETDAAEPTDAAAAKRYFGEFARGE